MACSLPQQISIHALRKEGDILPLYLLLTFLISIHALRKEGDRQRCKGLMQNR